MYFYLTQVCTGPQMAAGPGFLRAATATTSCGIEFLDFLQPAVATFYVAVPSASVVQSTFA